MKQKNIELKIFCGSCDEDCLSMAEQLYEITNAGNVENKGFELALTSTPYKKKSFTWDMALNFSKNKNSIIELTETTTRQVLSDGSVSFLKVVADVGGLYGDIL